MLLTANTHWEREEKGKKKGGMSFCRGREEKGVCKHDHPGHHG